MTLTTTEEERKIIVFHDLLQTQHHPNYQKKYNMYIKKL